MIIFLTILYMLVVIPASLIWNGFVLTKLWLWFAVPMFGVAPLTIPAAIGIAMMVSYLTHQYQQENKEEDGIERMIKQTLLMIFKPAVALLFGWIVSQWM